MGACFFALRVLVVGEMTSLGFDGLYFFSTGSAIFCLVYFIYRKEWARRNDPLDEQTDKKNEKFFNFIYFCTYYYCWSKHT